MSKRKTGTLSDVLRMAIAESGLTLCQIAKETGVIIASLMRFMWAETSDRLDKHNVLAEYQGLRIGVEMNVAFRSAKVAFSPFARQWNATFAERKATM